MLCTKTFQSPFSLREGEKEIKEQIKLWLRFDKDPINELFHYGIVNYEHNKNGFSLTYAGRNELHFQWCGLVKVARRIHLSSEIDTVTVS
jgi:hypothetical protein